MCCRSQGCLPRAATISATGGYAGQGLDNGFARWSGLASIAWPEEGASLRLSSPDAGRFQVYSSPEGGLFVAEPVQYANAALNAPQEQWEGLGIVLLGQGESSTLHARLDACRD